jgi:hypothetical protein
MKKFFVFLFFAIFFSSLVLMLSTHVASAALVSCGNTDTGTSAGGCKFSDIFDTAVKLIEYMLSGAAVIAVGGVVYGGVSVFN